VARKPSHWERVLELLQDGEAHSHHEIYALNVIGHSRIADLRARHYVIEQWREDDPRTEETTYWYRLLGREVPAPAAVEASPGEGEAAGLASEFARSLDAGEEGLQSAVLPAAASPASEVTPQKGSAGSAGPADPVPLQLSLGEAA
jgi:hypothetical protein